MVRQKSLKRFAIIVWLAAFCQSTRATPDDELTPIGKMIAKLSKYPTDLPKEELAAIRAEFRKRPGAFIKEIAKSRSTRGSISHRAAKALFLNLGSESIAPLAAVLNDLTDDNEPFWAAFGMGCHGAKFDEAVSAALLTAMETNGKVYTPTTIASVVESYPQSLQELMLTKALSNRSESRDELAALILLKSRTLPTIYKGHAERFRKSPNPLLRAAYCYLLSFQKLPAESLFQVAKQMLADTDERVVSAMAKSLFDFAPEPALKDHFLKLAASDDTGLRIRALRHLSRMKSVFPEIAEQIYAMLFNAEDLFPKTLVAEAFSHIAAAMPSQRERISTIIRSGSSELLTMIRPVTCAFMYLPPDMIAAILERLDAEQDEKTIVSLLSILARESRRDRLLANWVSDFYFRTTSIRARSEAVWSFVCLIPLPNCADDLNAFIARIAPRDRASLFFDLPQEACQHLTLDSYSRLLKLLFSPNRGTRLNARQAYVELYPHDSIITRLILCFMMTSEGGQMLAMHKMKEFGISWYSRKQLEEIAFATPTERNRWSTIDALELLLAHGMIRPEYLKKLNDLLNDEDYARRLGAIRLINRYKLFGHFAAEFLRAMKAIEDDSMVEAELDLALKLIELNKPANSKTPRE